MSETKKEMPEETGPTYDEHVDKQGKLDKRIKETLHRVKVLAEAGSAVVGSNRVDRITIVPLCWAIKDDLTKLEDLVLENQDVTGVADFPVEMRKLWSV